MMLRASKGVDARYCRWCENEQQPYTLININHTLITIIVPASSYFIHNPLPLDTPVNTQDLSSLFIA